MYRKGYIQNRFIFMGQTNVIVLEAKIEMIDIVTSNHKINVKIINQIYLFVYQKA